MRPAAAVLLAAALLLAGCNLAGDITPPPALATQQAAETLPPPTTAPATSAPTSAPTVAAASTSPDAATPQAGTIRGSVANGTSGGRVPAGAQAVLTGFDGEVETLRETATLAADGTYVFEDVPAEPGRIYGVTVAYEDVLYFSEGAHLAGGDVPLDLPITIYETTTDASALSVERLHLLFDFTVPDRVQVIELWVISNTGDRTVVAAPPRGAAEVALPSGATGLAFEDGSVGDRYLLTADGFGDTQPIVPGTATSQFIFSYWMDYDGSLTLVQPSGYPVGAVVLLLPENGVSAAGAGLQDMGVQVMGGQSVHTYSGGAIPAGQALQVELAGDPQAEAAAGASSGGWTDAAIGLGVLGIAAIAAGLWWFRPRRSSRPRREPGAPDTEKLIGEIAALDDAFAAGGMDEAAYRARRETLKRALRERMPQA